MRMKLLTFVLVMLLATVAMAQERPGLHHIGPMPKQEKAVDQPVNSGPAPAYSKKELYGGELYNYQPWRHKMHLPLMGSLPFKPKRNIVVAIMGNGVNYNNPALRDHMWTNPAERNGKPGVDDDGNGWVDDIYGIDPYNRDGNPMEDTWGEGTQMAGLVMAAASPSDNRWAEPGRIKIMALKFGIEYANGAFSYSEDAVVSSLRYAQAHGVDVLLTLGGIVGADEIKKAAADFKGLIIADPVYDVTHNYDYDYLLTTGWKHVLGVANHDDDNIIADPHGEGPVRVDLTGWASTYTTTTFGNYAWDWGRIPTAAIVAGVAARVLSAYPGMSREQVSDLLRSTGAAQVDILGKTESIPLVDGAAALLGRSAGGRVYSSDWARIQDDEVNLRERAAICYDSDRDVVVIVGGKDVDKGDLSFTTLEWDGRKWKEFMFRPNREMYPHQLTGGRMVYDSRRKVCVLYGGTGQTTTWEWNGEHWKAVLVGKRIPQALVGASMVYDERRGVVVYFGGSYHKRYNETWEYGGQGWTQVNTAHAPSPRDAINMVYDPQSGYSYVFGGVDEDYTVHGDTWRYDGTDWKKLKSAEAIERKSFPFIYDPNHKEMIIFGGRIPSLVSTFAYDSWRFDGKKWQRITFDNPSFSHLTSQAVWSHKEQAILYFGSDQGNVEKGMDVWRYTGATEPFWIDSLPMGSGSWSGSRSADIALWNPSTGEWRVQGSGTVATLGKAGHIPVPADYSGNGRLEPATFSPITLKWYFQNRTVAFGQFGDTPAPGDYDGDGKAEIAVYRAHTGMYYVMGWKKPIPVGKPGEVAAPADYDGDGDIDFATYAPLTSTWSIEGMEPVVWGKTGQSPVPADYDGDGRADIATYDPKKRLWLVRSWSDGKTLLKKRLGKQHDIPVPGDYDGDGAAEPATFTPSTGMWQITGKPATRFGAIGDVPLVRGR